jgi:hypothetical protein
LWLPLLAASIWAVTAAAASDRGDYLAGVEQARALCVSARPGDVDAALVAASVLRRSSGESQLEVLGDLAARPPRFDDAAKRLLAVETALTQAPAPANPADADARLKAILAESRYQANGPSLLDRFYTWLLEQLLRPLAALTGGAGGIARLVEVGLALVVGVAIAVFLGRSLWSRRGGAAVPWTERSRPRPAVDWFGEADRRAAAGDYRGAVRALTSAVATAIGGEGAWETSPLTVRELFVSSARLEPLRPLLTPFEASVYGHREPDAKVYAAAAGAALPYREGLPS